MTYIRNINPRISIFLRGQAGATQLHFFVAKSGLPRCGRLGPSSASRGLGTARLGLGAAGWGQVQPAGARCGRPGLAWVRPRPTTAGWDLADRGQGVAGCGRSQPLQPFVIFYNFSIFHCIYNMAMCYFLIFLGFFHF
jgi:hypothetical protein